MRRTVNISFGLIIIIITLIAGFYFLIKAMLIQSELSSAQDISSFNVDELSVGDLLKGDISDYTLTGNPETGDKSQGMYSATNGLTWYDIYSIADVNGKNIRLFIMDEELKDKFYEFADGESAPFYFEAEVVASPTEVNSAWYEKAYGLTSPEEVENVVRGDIILTEAVFSQNGINAIAGIVLILASIATFFVNGGVSSVVNMEVHSYNAKYTSDEKLINSLTKHSDIMSMHKITTLIKEEENLLLRLMLQRDSIVKRIRRYILFFALAFICIFVFPSQLKIIAIILSLYFAVKIIIDFLNTSNRLAVFFAQLFKIKSVHLQIENSLEHVSKLEGVLTRLNENLGIETPTHEEEDSYRLDSFFE